MAKRYWINYLKEYIFTPSAPANDSTSQTGTFKALQERVLNRLAAYSGKPWYQDPDTTLTNAATHISQGSSAHGGVLEKLQKDGADAPKQRTVNFTGPGVTVADDGVNSRTNVDIPGGGGGGGGSAHIIQEEGGSLIARSRLNFRGVGATASDDSANDRSNVDIRGNVHRSTTAPTSPVTGELWLDTNFSPATLRSYDGSAWVNTSGTPADGTVTDVKVASGAGIAKSKLANLAVDRTDMATDRTILVTCTSSSRPINPVTGQAIYETDTQLVLVNTGSPGTPVWNSITASQSYQGPSFKEGLALTWDAGNTLGVETGAAYIEGSSTVVAVPTRLTRAVTFNASENGFRYVYLWDNGGSPDIEISQTAPASPYRGWARSKSGDASRRYIGAIRANGAATPAMWKFRQEGTTVYWLESLNGAQLFYTNGVAISETTVSCSTVVPVSSRELLASLSHGWTSSMVLGNGDDNFTLTTGSYLLRIPAASSTSQISEAHTTLQLSTAQSFSYMFSTAPSSGGLGLFARARGYVDRT